MLPAFALVLLGACGGDGGEGSSGTAPRPGSEISLSGAAAANVALADYILDILTPAGPDGVQSTRVIAGLDGTYAATSPIAPGPFPIAASREFFFEGVPQYQRLYSIAHRSGTANITPLTSLLVARLLNRKPGPQVDSRAVFELQGRTEADVAVAQQQVINYLLSRSNPVDVSSVTSFISTPLTVAPGNTYFDALTRLHDSLMDSETIGGLEEHMLFRNDGPANLLAMLELDFMADCTVLGVDDGSMPSGSTRIILDPRAIRFGTALDLPFQTGDRVALVAGLTAAERWRFALSQGFVFLDIKEGLLSGVEVFTVALNPARCVPQSEVSLAGKHPSLIALMGLFASTSQTTFQCPDPITFPGFQNGTNTWSIDANGALRINGPSGPALHLPSLHISIDAPITVVAGQVQPIRPTAFAAVQSFGDGVNELDVRITGAGVITGLRLTRRNAQSFQSQTCGTIGTFGL